MTSPELLSPAAIERREEFTVLIRARERCLEMVLSTGYALDEAARVDEPLCRARWRLALNELRDADKALAGFREVKS